MSYCYWGLKVYGFDKPPVINVGIINVYITQTPTIYRLSMLRDAQTFPFSQSK